jgi:hypothetical protein
MRVVCTFATERGFGGVSGGPLRASHEIVQYCAMARHGNEDGQYGFAVAL